MNLDTIPNAVVGLCYKLSRRHPEPEDAIQELLLQAWLNRALPPKVLTVCLQRRNIDLIRKATRPVGKRGQKVERPECGSLTPACQSRLVAPPVHDPLEYRGPEADVAAMLVDGWRPVDIARKRGVGEPNICRRIKRIREYFEMRAA